MEGGREGGREGGQGRTSAGGSDHDFLVCLLVEEADGGSGHLAIAADNLRREGGREGGRGW
jgi:hypothetical protein